MSRSLFDDRLYDRVMLHLLGTSGTVEKIDLIAAKHCKCFHAKGVATEQDKPGYNLGCRYAVAARSLTL